MKILVLGAGGIGGYFGGRLAQAGADVTFLVRPARAAKLAQSGLVIRSPAGDARLPVATVTETDLRPVYDLAILACKAYDLDVAGAALAPAVGPHTAILPMLNGLRHIDELAGRFGAVRVLGGLAHIAVTLTPDGEIHHLGNFHLLAFGERSGGRSPRCEAFSEICAEANFASRLSDNINLELWEKFVFLATLAGMTCLMRANVGAIMRADDGEALTRDMLEECRRVAAVSGHPPRPDVLAGYSATLTERGSKLTASVLRDIERGARIEGEHIVGDMLRRARALGIVTPLLRAALAHLQAYERGRGGS
ncbi:MAG: 2-dehydropantoate 2-reductase [Betaproteobacteria bacterium]|nr:2-dehydropantoate 2-reductase [Betaproteobacteria bacterium]